MTPHIKRAPRNKPVGATKPHPSPRLRLRKREKQFSKIINLQQMNVLIRTRRGRRGRCSEAGGGVSLSAARTARLLRLCICSSRSSHHPHRGPGPGRSPSSRGRRIRCAICFQTPASGLPGFNISLRCPMTSFCKNQPQEPCSLLRSGATHCGGGRLRSGSWEAGPRSRRR